MNNETEELVCRVCHCEGEPDRPLYYPCKCDGSIKFVHQDCLLQWLKVKSQSLTDAKCELCGQVFRFRNVYETGDPPRLSIYEFYLGLLPMATAFVDTAYHISCALFLWVVCLPVATSMWSDICSAILYRKNIYEIIELPNSIGGWISFWWGGVVSISFVAFFTAGLFQFGYMVYQVIGICFFITILSLIYTIRFHRNMSESIKLNNPPTILRTWQPLSQYKRPLDQLNKFKKMGR